MGEREFRKYQPRTIAEEEGACEEIERAQPKCKNWPYGPSLGNTAIVLVSESSQSGSDTAIASLEQGWEAAYAGV
jgi:hypothetical protein